MSKAKVVMIHGAYGTPEENWFPWLASRVREYGQEAIVPAFPTPENQTPDVWREAFARQVGSVDRNMILVGHSLGPAFILRLLEEAEGPVQGIYLVSGFLGALGQPDFDTINAPFFASPFNWERIRANAGIARVYNSDNDPYVPLEKGKELAQNLSVDLKVIKGGGHVNASSGFGPFNELLDDLVTTFQWRG